MFIFQGFSGSMPYIFDFAEMTKNGQLFCFKQVFRQKKV
jgi:hypothetical protein